MKKQLKQLAEQISKLKQEQLDLIKSNTRISKLEKLDFIDMYDLFITESYIQSVFEDLKVKWRKELMFKYKREHFTIDDFIVTNTNCSRYETINLYYFIDNLQDEINDENEEIEVLTVRGYDDVYKMKFKDVVDYICDWCLKNKCIGFKLDW